MSNKGTTQNALSTLKTSLANTKDRTKLLEDIKDYIDKLTPDTFPSIEEASIYAHFSYQGLLQYEARTEEASPIRCLLDEIRIRQKIYLMKNGLIKKLDSSITQMILAHSHNMKNQPQNLTQNNTFNISPELLAEALELSRSKK